MNERININRNSYILTKANPVISDYDDIYNDSKNINFITSHRSGNDFHHIDNIVQNNPIESSSDKHLMTTTELLHPQRPKYLNQIENVPAIVYGPLPFS